MNLVKVSACLALAVAATAAGFMGRMYYHDKYDVRPKIEKCVARGTAQQEVEAHWLDIRHKAGDLIASGHYNSAKTFLAAHEGERPIRVEFKDDDPFMFEDPSSCYRWFTLHSGTEYWSATGVAIFGFIFSLTLFGMAKKFA